MLKLEELSAYRLSKKCANEIWSKVLTWDVLAKKTIGEQLIRSFDSIGANISEGFGRFHKKDKVKFYYNARASVYESAYWINLAFERKLIDQGLKTEWLSVLRKLPKEINTLIKLTISNLKQ
jgi:four helix bundle protein